MNQKMNKKANKKMKQTIYITFFFYAVLLSCSSHKTDASIKTKIVTGFVFA